MEEKIKKLKNDIEILQNVYDNDIKNGKNEENDQIQANRQKGINKLQEELREVEIEKLSKLKERKVELEGILKKKESLNKDKEQLEQAIYEISEENEIQGGKIVKTQEQVEYENDLGKVNAELDSLKVYEEELNGINAEIGEISEKYNIKENAKENKIYSKESDENANIHHIKMSDGQEVILVEDIYNQNQFNIDGMKTYMYNVIGKEGKAKVVYLDEDLDFDMINKDDKYAYIVRDFLSPARIERLSSQEAKGKGVVDFLYVGNIQKDQESEIGYKRIRYTDDYIYNKISKKEYEFESKNKKELENNIEKYGEDKYRKGLETVTGKLESIINQRPDLYKENIKDENTTNQQNNNTIEKSNIVEPNNNIINRPNIVEPNNNTINRPNTVEPNYNSTNKQNTIEQDNKNTSMVEYKKDNRIIAWIKDRFNGIKEKFNSVKERFSKSKNNKEEVELNEVGEAWQDYIDMQEGKPGKESKAKGFKEGLQVKGQQLKQSKIARKLTRQNEKDKKANQFEADKKLVEKHGKQQEDDEIDL